MDSKKLIKIKKELKGYLKIVKKINNKPVKQDIGSNLIERLFNKEIDILEYFNLPDAEEFLLVLRKLLVEDDIDKTIKRLNKVSKKYSIIQDTSSRLEMLKNAIENREDGMSILPKIGIRTHVYTIFLYKLLILDMTSDYSEILNEMDLAQNHLNDLRMIELEYSKRRYNKLKKFNFHFLEAFIEYNKMIKDDYCT